MNRSEVKDLALVLSVAFLASLVWCLTKGSEIEGDEAIMGLMALKICRGEEFPVFFWQAHYSGPVASYLVAPLHWFLDPSPLVLHSAVIPIHLFYSAGVYFLARKWMAQREAVIAGLFAALPGQLFPYSALGGFTESMALVPWAFLLCLGESGNERLRFWFGGFLCGFALWVFPLAFPPVLACFISQYKAYRGKAVPLGLLGCLLGLLPAVYYNISQPGATLLRLFSRPSALDRQAAAQMVSSEGLPSFLSHVLSKWADSSYEAFLNIPRFTLSLLGLVPGASVWAHIGGFVAFFALLFALGYFFRYRGKEKALPVALLGTLIVTYGFLVFFGLNRDRYLLPVLLVVPFALASGIHRLSVLWSRRLGSVAAAFLLLLNGLANFLDTAPRYPDYPGLARFLESKSLTRGYAPYGAAYPLVYLSNERLVYTPALDESKFDRRAEYTACVARAEHPAFIFNDQRGADRFKERLAVLNASWKEVAWASFRVLYELTPPVNLERLRSAVEGQAHLLKG